MIITKANKTDLSKILELQYLAYQSEAKLFNNQKIPPLTQTLKDIEEDYNKGIILKVLNEDSIIIGSVRAYCDTNIIYIGKLMVHPKWQRQGIGTNLLLEVENIYPNRIYELFTSSKSENNLRLYKNLGYKVFKEKSINDELKFIYLRKDSLRSNIQNENSGYGWNGIC